MRTRAWLAGQIGMAAAFGLTGCATLPMSGPTSEDVRAGVVQPDSVPYTLIKLTTPVLDVLARDRPRFSETFSDRRPPGRVVFGIGDVVSVTVFEATSGGLFIPAEASARPGNFITLPNQSIDSNGNISVPYAGLIRAAGRTQPEVQTLIVDALKERALQPQAAVALVDQRTSLISVLGEVNNPVRVPASAAGERVLDAITRAGGPKNQGFDTWVMLERAGKRATVSFGALVYDPSNNIYVRPNDTIYVYREPQTFTAFGAFTAGLTTQAQFNFDAWHITLTKAIAKAGGLNDSQADPASVFVYRLMSRKIAQDLGVDISHIATDRIPVIFNVNFRDPSAYFLTSQFEMQNNDVLYASNAQAVDTVKLLNYIRTITATVTDPIVSANVGASLSSAVSGGTTTTVVTTPPAIPAAAVAGPVVAR